MPGKGNFLADLDVLTNALMVIAQFVARLAPIGVFALVDALTQLSGRITTERLDAGLEEAA